MACKNFFSFNFPLREFYFCTSPSPPHKFSNGPSLRVTLSVLSSFEFKSVDDVGAGKLREVLTLHTNPHAVHGRFTLKDDCERQVWNSGAVS